MTAISVSHAIASLLEDAPNPADCPHHHCNYTPVGTSIGIFLLIVLIVLVVLVVLIIVGVHRVRARRRGRGSSQPPVGPPFS